MTSPGEMFACLLTREAELGFHELIYLRGDLVLVLVYLLCCVSGSHGPELLLRGVSQCLVGMFTPGANKNYQTFTPISLIGFQGGGRGV